MADYIVPSGVDPAKIKALNAAYDAGDYAQAAIIGRSITTNDADIATYLGQRTGTVDAQATTAAAQYLAAHNTAASTTDAAAKTTADAAAAKAAADAAAAKAAADAAKAKAAPTPTSYLDSTIVNAKGDIASIAETLARLNTSEAAITDSLHRMYPDADVNAALTAYRAAPSFKAAATTTPAAAATTTPVKTAAQVAAETAAQNTAGKTYITPNGSDPVKMKAFNDAYDAGQYGGPNGAAALGRAMGYDDSGIAAYLAQTRGADAGTAANTWLAANPAGVPTSTTVGGGTNTGIIGTHLIQPAAGGAAGTPPVTGYTAAQADVKLPGASGYTSTPATASTVGATNGYTAAPANATGYEGIKQDNVVNAGVTNNNVNQATSTVQGQISGIIAANSPLMQNAKSTALAQMNDRGLINSSMAVGAGQNAVIQSALPIATSDAATYANAATQNANAANTASLTNAGAANTVNANNAGIVNRAAEFGAGATNTANLTNAANTNRASEFTAGAANTAALENAQLGTTTALNNAANTNQAAAFTAGAGNTAALTGAQLATNTSVTNAAATNTANAAGANALNQAGIVGSQLASAQAIAQLNSTTQQAINTLDNKYKQILQTDASASSLYSQAMAQIAAINGNVNISDKQGAIDNITTQLDNGLAILGVLADSHIVSAQATAEKTAATKTAADAAAQAAALTALDNQTAPGP